MTIEEAIVHCDDRAKADCSECAEEHKQLAKWLRELQKYKEIDLEPEEIKPYIELSEKMNLCDLVRENKRLSDRVRFLEAQLN